MEGNVEYLKSLSESLAEYRISLEKVLSEVKEHFHILGSFYVNIKNIFVKKGLLADDPYRYEKKISDIKPIPEDGFLENEKATILSIRIAEFEAQLDFLQNFYSFSLDAFDLPRIKRLILFVKFIKWKNINPNHSDINTRVMGEMIQKIRSSDDSMGINLLNDGVKQLALYQQKILEGLKQVTTYLREDYKFLLRQSVYPSVDLKVQDWDQDQNRCLREIKKVFAQHMRGQPFVPELIKEALEEDLTETGKELQAEILKKLNAPQNKKDQKKKIVDFKGMIMDSVRTLASANLPLESALRKLRENSNIIEKKAQSFGQKFRSWLMNILGQKDEKRVYVLEFIDAITSASRTEKIDFIQFDQSTTNIIRILVNLSNRTSPQFLALKSKQDDKIMDYQHSSFVKVKRCLDILEALDTYFKSEVPREKRNVIRGIKTELTEIKMILNKSNKIRHEYVAAKEEVEQLKKLGIS
jgi:hypothetical protein